MEAPERVESASSAVLPTPRATPDDRSRATQGWHWFAPRAGVCLIVAALLGLVWIPLRQEQEENRAGLIRDVLWLEQNIQFSLASDAGQLWHLAQDSTGADLDEHRLELRVKHLLPNCPGLVQVVLLDRRGALPGELPGGDPFPRRAALAGLGQRARLSARPEHREARLRPPARLGERPPVRDLSSPTIATARAQARCVGVYSLKSFLTGVVPWWLAEKHRVTLRDANDTVLAAKSNVAAAGRPELTHQAPLDPPGHGLLLHVESYGSQTKLLRNVLVFTRS